jgi:RHS repeat-associated protein
MVSMASGSGSWQNNTLNYTIPVNYPQMYLQIYPWNQTGNVGWFDDLKVTFTTGNVEAPDQLNMATYYPHGSVMPGMNYSSSYAYKYGYQGQFAEMDNESNENFFELRNYDPLLGRFNTTDPYDQYFSPYMAMDNSHPNSVDPDGGWCKGMAVVGLGVGIGTGITVSLINNKNMSVEAQLATVAGCGAAGLLAGGFHAEIANFFDNTSINVDMLALMGSIGAQQISVDAQSYNRLGGSMTFTVPVVKLTGKTTPSSYDGIDVLREVAGATLWDLGSKNIIKPRAGVSGGGNAGKMTSRASVALRKADKTIQKKLVEKKILKKAVTSPIRLFGTKGIGAIAGRFIPFVGVGLLIWDVYDNWDLIKEYSPYLGKGMVERQKLMAQYPYDIPVCFEKGTQIFTNFGFKPIESVIIGDSLFSFCFEEKILRKNSVIKTFKRETNEIYVLETKHEKISVTGEHPFYVENKGWTKVNKLTVNDIFISDNNEKVELVKIHKISKKIRVFNLEVERDHNYFITKTKILVHNK